MQCLWGLDQVPALTLRLFLRAEAIFCSAFSSAKWHFSMLQYRDLPRIQWHCAQWSLFCAWGEKIFNMHVWSSNQYLKDFLLRFQAQTQDQQRSSKRRLFYGSSYWFPAAPWDQSLYLPWLQNHITEYLGQACLQSTFMNWVSFQPFIFASSSFIWQC